MNIGLINIGLSETIAASALLLGIVALGMNWRQRYVLRRESGRLRTEIERGDQDCLGKIQDCLSKIGQVNDNIEESERNAQSSAELLHDGRLTVSTRSRALRMLRSGMAAETAATELGMAKNEVRLLQKVAAVLTPRA